MGFEQFLRGSFGDVFGNVLKPAESARKRKESADMVYALKILLVCGVFFMLGVSLFSFVGDCASFVYSLEVSHDKFDLGGVAGGFFNLVLLAVITSLVLLAIGVPVFLVVSFVWAALLWCLGKAFGGKASYERFFCAVAPMYMSLVFVFGLAVSFISEFLGIIGTFLGYNVIQLAMVQPVIGLVLLPIWYVIVIYYETIYVSEVHEMPYVNALKAVIILAVTLLCLALLVLLGIMLAANSVMHMVPGYGRYAYY